MDTTTRVVSALLVLVLVVTAAAMFVVLPLALAVLLSVAYAAILWASWALAPSAYEVEASPEGPVLRVQRNGWRPLEAVVRGPAAMADPHRMGLRVGGSGGAFGHYGRFRRGDVGVYRAYLTTRDPGRVVALDTHLGVVTVSPEDPAALRSALGVTP